METRTYTVYSFNELNEKAKSKALEELRYINVEGEWWESTYEDAERVGIRITSFDTGRSEEITGEIMVFGGMAQVIALILKEHGKMCETYKTAKEYRAKLAKLNSECEEVDGDDESNVDYETWQDKRGTLEQEFTQAILRDYLRILRDECEYLQGDEAVGETIEANEYRFLSNGKPEPVLPKES